MGEGESGVRGAQGRSGEGQCSAGGSTGEKGVWCWGRGTGRRMHKGIWSVKEEEHREGVCSAGGKQGKGQKKGEHGEVGAWGRVM